MVGRRYIRWSRGMVVLIGCLVLPVTLLVFKGLSGAQRRAQRDNPPDLPEYSIGSIKLVNLQTLKIRAGEFHHSSADLTEGGDCAVRGRILGLTGGNRDVRVLVLNDDQMIKWLNTPARRDSAVALYQSPQQAATAFNVPVSKADAYHLVISNDLPLSTDKTIQASAELTCTGKALAP